MTAEIILMNRSGISLAADSAVTTGFMSVQKIFTSANKIFTLSKYNPIGIMFFNLATFMNGPWELLVKDYRARLGKKSFPSVEEAAIDFVNYLKDFSVPYDLQKDQVKSKISGYFEATRDYVNELLRKEYGERVDGVALTKSEIDRILFKHLDEERIFLIHLLIQVLHQK